MWCRVQECRGEHGERLKREAWSKPVVGDLRIHNGRDTMVATLMRPDVTREHQVLFPLFDVRVRTFDAGVLVSGFQLHTDETTRQVREVRQVWYCVPDLLAS